MKKILIITWILLMGALTACAGNPSENEKDELDRFSEESEYIADDMTVTYEKDKEFIVLKVKDDYMENIRSFLTDRWPGSKQMWRFMTVARPDIRAIFL